MVDIEQLAQDTQKLIHTKDVPTQKLKEDLETLYAYQYHPDVVALHLGDIYFKDSAFDDAITWYRRALSHNGMLGEALERIIFITDSNPKTPEAVSAQLRQEWWDKFGAKLYANRKPHKNTKDPNRNLRIGYVSGDFKWHSAVLSIAEIIGNHSDEFDVFFYNTLPPAEWDDLTKDWRGLRRNRFTDASGFTTAKLISTIRHDKIDILVDLSGFTGNNRLQAFAGRPAPIQLHGWGYVLSTGTPMFDGLLVDPIVATPDIRARMPEKAVDLPSMLTYYTNPDLPNLNSPLPCLTKPPVFGVYQRALKINPETVKVWRTILERLPDASIRFEGGGYTDTIKATIREGFGPTQSRVSFHHVKVTVEYLLDFKEIDLSLDPWPQTGGISTLDSLWMGVPMITLIGPKMIQRTSASFLDNVGLGDFVTDTPEAYINEAVRWVTDRKEELADIRSQLRPIMRHSPIITGYGTAVEEAYRTLWHEWCETGTITK